MSIATLDHIAQQLPPGRARKRYEQLGDEIGEAFVVTVPSGDLSLWLVHDAEAAGRLTQVGVPRWKIWTLHEVREFIGAFGTVVTTLAEAAHLLEGPEPKSSHLFRR